MQTERDVRDSHTLSDGLVDVPVPRSREMNGYATIPISSSTSVSSPSSFAPVGANFIEHRVSKMDTLAGVAIKYGVEVADIKRMNGLVTDRQMFARKSLQIPLPGRHPPSPVMSNGSTQKGEKSRQPQSRDIVDSLQSLKLKPSPRRLSPAMCSLQGYYGLTQSNKNQLPEGTEMSVFKSGKSLMFEDDAKFLESPASNPVHSRLQKTPNLDNGFSLDNGHASENINELDGWIRRRKSDADPSFHTPEILLKEEGTGSAFSGRAGKGLALRPKLGSRTDLDDGRQNTSLGSDSLIGDVSPSVQKSSSATNLSESENISSIWPASKWSLKPDVIARPIFDGFQKPLAAWRNKAALD
ncbi:hypothetical protein IEQ34_020036 [Dendrobium chrysotoxum]|uniref:LysM domain-containing protein n=1 Tax=Dendrobium chrysotoxum TaxID=161865 RepID=A0AAV7GAD0_DENCH|nr:hypothetical protein IEQ34_020036 [Dendrobium chrysotoxum]